MINYIQNTLWCVWLIAILYDDKITDRTYFDIFSVGLFRIVTCDITIVRLFFLSLVKTFLPWFLLDAVHPISNLGLIVISD